MLRGTLQPQAVVIGCGMALPLIPLMFAATAVAVVASGGGKSGFKRGKTRGPGERGLPREGVRVLCKKHGDCAKIGRKCYNVKERGGVSGYGTRYGYCLNVIRVPPPPPPPAPKPNPISMDTPLDSARVYGGAFGRGYTAEPTPGRWMGWGTDIEKEYDKKEWDFFGDPPRTAWHVRPRSAEIILLWKAFAPRKWEFRYGTHKRNAHVDVLEPVFAVDWDNVRALTGMITGWLEAGLEVAAAGMGMVAGAGAVAGAGQMLDSVIPAVNSSINYAEQFSKMVERREALAGGILGAILAEYERVLLLWNPHLNTPGFGLDLRRHYKCNPVTVGDLFQPGDSCPPPIFIPGPMDIRAFFDDGNDDFAPLGLLV